MLVLISLDSRTPSTRKSPVIIASSIIASLAVNVALTLAFPVIVVLPVIEVAPVIVVGTFIAAPDELTFKYAPEEPTYNVPSVLTSDEPKYTPLVNAFPAFILNHESLALPINTAALLLIYNPVYPVLTAPAVTMSPSN